MRLVVVSCLALASGACATGKATAPAPGAFERVAERLSDPAWEVACLLYAYCQGANSGKRRLERETDRNPADRRDSIIITTAIGDNRRQERVMGTDRAGGRPASDPRPTLPLGATSADTPNQARPGQPAAG